MTRAAWTDGRTLVVFVAVFALLGAGSFAWVYGAPLVGNQGPIRSDGFGYYAYLPAIGLQHDLKMEDFGDEWFSKNPLAALLGPIQRVPPHANYFDQYPIGEALMLAPFFAVGHLGAIATGANRDGFSWPYQVTAVLGAFLYGVAGLIVLWRLLRRWFSLWTVVVTMVVITYGTDFFHYATFDALFTHVFAFFLIAVALRLTVALWERPRLGLAIALGAVLALVTLLRNTDLAIVLFCCLIGVTRPRDLLDRARALVRRADLVAAGLASFVVVLIPQLVYWKVTTGRFIVDSYDELHPGLHLTLLHPHLLDVAFSIRHGLFFWAPLLLLAVAGLPLLHKQAPALFVPALVFLVVDFWVTASWPIWWYGAGYGERPFVDVLPVFALGLAAFVETLRRLEVRRVVLVVMAVLTLVSVHGMLAYWTQLISYDNPTASQYLKSFRHPCGCG